MQRQSRTFLAAAVLQTAFALAAAEPAASATERDALAEVNAALQAGEADKALTLLASLPDGGAEMAAAENLHCRIEYTLGHWDAAIQHCEQSVRLDPQESTSHLWLGRALGEKASRASFLSAYSLGKRVLAEFQAAVKLNPRNGGALGDLAEFDVEAPSVIGGGLDKAQSVAEQLDRVDPGRAAEIRARIQEHHKDFGGAEQALKLGFQASPHPAYQWATLARFYQQRSRWQDMDAAIASCEAAVDRDPHAGVALYDAAGALIASEREPALAARLLEKYLNGPGRSEEAPAFVAYVRLARLKDKLGDAAGAKQAQAQALALAHTYTPEQDSRR
jgi:tetratricopeptide (TPR) repeat protein